MAKTHTWRRAAFMAGAAVLAINFVVGARIYSAGAGAEDGGRQESGYDYIRLMTEVLGIVRKDYVDSDRVGYRDLIYGALEGMLTSLDPHSQFMKPEMYSEMKEDTEGHFGGLGIVITMKDGLLTVVAPMEDTPGYRAGLLPEDRIFRIEGQPTDRLTLHEAVKQLRGLPGTDVTITVVRPATGRSWDVTITREQINVPSVKGTRMLDDEIGYIRVVQFNEPTDNDLAQALRELESKNLRGLILDLRNNPGGLLDSAVRVASRFIGARDLVVSTEGRTASQQKRYVAFDGAKQPDYPVVILVNRGSASGSEIVAGALQDHGRAILMGEKTFGKGSVQSVLPLRDGSAVRLTTAKYYTPSHREIHGNGIAPDIDVPISPVEQLRILELRQRPEPLTPDEEEEFVDHQLQRAHDVLRAVLLLRDRRGSPLRTAAVVER